MNNMDIEDEVETNSALPDDAGSGYMQRRYQPSLMELLLCNHLNRSTLRSSTLLCFTASKVPEARLHKKSGMGFLI